MAYIRKKDNLNENAQEIDEHNWFYDGLKKLTFVHEVVDKEGNYIQTDQFEVSIRQLVDFISKMK